MRKQTRCEVVNKYLETIFIKATGDMVHIKDQINFDNKCQNSGEQKRNKKKKRKEKNPELMERI